MVALTRRQRLLRLTERVGACAQMELAGHHHTERPRHRMAPQRGSRMEPTGIEPVTSCLQAKRRPPELGPFGQQWAATSPLSTARSSPRDGERAQTAPLAGLSVECPRQESNLDLPLRRRSSYPLDYEGAGPSRREGPGEKATGALPRPERSRARVPPRRQGARGRPRPGGG